MPLRNHPKILLLSPYLNCSRIELNDKIFISFSLLCACCVRRRSRCERGRTRRRTVPRASVRGPVPRPRTRRTVLRSGPPGRIWRRQVQSHPLMHILSQFYKHNLLACFIKLHMFCLLKTWLDSHPLIVITIPWPPRLMSDFVWTLVAVRTLRILHTIQLIL